MAENIIQQLDPPNNIVNDPSRLQTWLNQVYDMLVEKREWNEYEINATITSTVTTIDTITIDRVREGDRYLCIFNYNITKGGTGGETEVHISTTRTNCDAYFHITDSGTTLNSVSGYLQNHTANNRWGGTLCGVLRVTEITGANPSLDIFNEVRSQGSNSTTNTNGLTVYKLHTGKKQL